MLIYNSFIDSIIFFYTYMFVYNLSLSMLFWILMSNADSFTKTLSSLSGLNLSSSSLLLISITLFSMAGVPPFAGFLTKLFLLNIILNQKVFYFYFYFFVLLFLGLYFYIQNMRFLHSTSYDANPVLKFNLHPYVPITYAYFSVSVSFALVFGVLFLDDILLFFSWIFY